MKHLYKQSFYSNIVAKSEMKFSLLPAVVFCFLTVQYGADGQRFNLNAGANDFAIEEGHDKNSGYDNTHKVAVVGPYGAENQEQNEFNYANDMELNKASGNNQYQGEIAIGPYGAYNRNHQIGNNAADRRWKKNSGAGWHDKYNRVGYGPVIAIKPHRRQ